MGGTSTRHTVLVSARQCMLHCSSCSLGLTMLRLDPPDERLRRNTHRIRRCMWPQPVKAKQLHAGLVLQEATHAEPQGSTHATNHPTSTCHAAMHAPRCIWHPGTKHVTAADHTGPHIQSKPVSQSPCHAGPQGGTTHAPNQHLCHRWCMHHAQLGRLATWDQTSPALTTKSHAHSQKPGGQSQAFVMQESKGPRVRPTSKPRVHAAQQLSRQKPGI